MAGWIPVLRESYSFMLVVDEHLGTELLRVRHIHDYTQYVQDELPRLFKQKWEAGFILSATESLPPPIFQAIGECLQQTYNNYVQLADLSSLINSATDERTPNFTSNLSQSATESLARPRDICPSASVTTESLGWNLDHTPHLNFSFFRETNDVMIIWESVSSFAEEMEPNEDILTQLYSEIPGMTEGLCRF
jgi:hypothetical protein